MKNKRLHLLAAVAVVAAMVAVTGCQQTRAKKEEKPVKELSRIHFDFDKSAIKSEYKTTLESNAQWAKQHTRSDVVIEGHCDERGSTEYNIALGWRRARSAKNYMVSLGVDADRLSTKSYGEERPLCTESNESCWWKNRRAEFLKK